MGGSNMTDPILTTRQKVERGIGRRRRAEWWFRSFGVMGIGFGLLCLLALLLSIFHKGAPAFRQTVVEFPVIIDGSYLEITRHSDQEALLGADYEGLVRRALKNEFATAERQDHRALYRLIRGST